MPGELITEEQPRIKFNTVHDGCFTHCDDHDQHLIRLSNLQAKLESIGVIPILNDGLVGGNCSITFPDLDSSFYISKSGKQPHITMHPSDFVLVTSFDRTSWSATYKSSQNTPPSSTITVPRPSSDTPLHAVALLNSTTDFPAWTAQPRVCVHGHALAEGDQLTRAQEAGMPISTEETLFSTPEDMDAVIKLFKQYKYPEHKCFIRRGHGFLVLAETVDEAEDYIDTVILPLLVTDNDKNRYT